jgi:hypothetical protein
MGLKEWGRSLGVISICIGVLCFPVGFGVSPKRDLNVFSNLADLNLFFEAGVALVGAGGLVCIVSVFLPSAEGGS